MENGGWQLSDLGSYRGFFTGEHMDGGGQVRILNFSHENIYMTYYNSFNPLDVKLVGTGAYLVRAAQVPEPTTVSILLLGLISLAVRTKKMTNS